MKIKNYIINKKIIYIVIVLSIITSFFVGYSFLDSTNEVAFGTISVEGPNQTCNQRNLYDKLSCMSTLDSVKSLNVEKGGIKFNDRYSKTNGNGIYKLTSTYNNQYPITYYRGIIDNNYLEFADYCWRIIRTTDTGGIRIIYNGPKNANNTCSNDSMILGYVNFNDLNNKKEESLSYTYGDSLTRSTLNLTYDTLEPMIIDEDVSRYEYYYSDSYTYDENTSTYSLVNPEKIRYYSYESDNITKRYTCKSSSSSTCSTLTYVEKFYDYKYTTSRQLRFGQGIDDVREKYYASDEYINNGDGTYTLSGTIIEVYDDEFNSKHVGYELNYEDENSPVMRYVAKSIISNKLYKVLDTDRYTYYTENSHVTYQMGNELNYSNSNLEISNPYVDWELDKYIDTYQYVKLNSNNDILCLMNKTSNDSYNYVYNVYIMPNNGVTSIEEAIENTKGNAHDSTIKSMIDLWYENNLLSDYSSYIEDTPYCNDRRKDIKERFYDLYNEVENGQIDFSCPTSDSYTVSNQIGNGYLKYPIALADLRDVYISGSMSWEKESYLTPSNRNNYYLMSPLEIYEGKLELASMNDTLGIQAQTAISYFGNVGARPVITLKRNTVVSGKGTIDNPYKIELPS